MKRRFLLLSVVLVSAVVATAQSTASNESFKVCMASLQAQKFELAVAECTKAISSSPNSAEPYQMRAFAHVYLKNNQLALEDITKAIQLSPNNALMHSTRGEIFLELKKPNFALDDFQTVLLLKPNNADALLRRAQIYSYLGKRDLAIKDYRTLLAIRPDEKVRQALATLEASPDAGERYSNDIYNYAFQVPRDSKKVTSLSGTAVKFEGDKTKFNLSFFVLEAKNAPDAKDMSTQISTEAGAKTVATKLVTRLKADPANAGCTLLETKRMKVAGRDALKIVFSTSAAGIKTRKAIVFAPVPEQGRTYEFLVSASYVDFDKWFASTEPTINSFEILR